MRDHKQRHKNVMTLPNNPEKKHHALLSYRNTTIRYRIRQGKKAQQGVHMDVTCENPRTGPHKNPSNTTSL